MYQGRAYGRQVEGLTGPAGVVCQSHHRVLATHYREWQFMRRSILATLLLLAAYPAAHAQLVRAGNPAAPARHSAGIAFNFAQPLGDFGQNVRNGFGIDGMGTLGLDSRGIFSLRV